MSDKKEKEEKKHKEEKTEDKKEKRPEKKQKEEKDDDRNEEGEEKTEEEKTAEQIQLELQKRSSLLLLSEYRFSLSLSDTIYSKQKKSGNESETS